MCGYILYGCRVLPTSCKYLLGSQVSLMIIVMVNLFHLCCPLHARSQYLIIIITVFHLCVDRSVQVHGWLRESWSWSSQTCFTCCGQAKYLVIVQGMSCNHNYELVSLVCGQGNYPLHHEEWVWWSALWTDFTCVTGQVPSLLWGISLMIIIIMN